MIQRPKWSKVATLFKGSGYFASRGKIAPCYFAIWRQNSPNNYFAANAKLALSLMLTQTKEKHYFPLFGLGFELA